jgi:hypothetical protein
MSYVGFEPTILASDRAKTFHDSDRSATVTGYENIIGIILSITERLLML